ncbi:uncharacterized protein LOC112030543 [Quercus suber]|uniref:uncharacterized protein LOC112030543 n=1 Tax=Quercus suber TaxID=58331 RepID=UPI000CE22A52|nr:uncharacterized protein LOC112030543 [Quercus suber]
MSKAYDMVEWRCLEQIMWKMGFVESWINLIMRCINTVTYAVRINGALTGQIIPSRGLRATVVESTEILRILKVYKDSSGQQLNKEKTALYFNRNTPMENQETIKNMLGAQVIRQHETFLGLPSLIGRSKTNTFAQLKAKVAKKLAGWKEKLFSTARKEALIEAVAQAVLTHTMSCFKLPNAICDELTSMAVSSGGGRRRRRKGLHG